MVENSPKSADRVTESLQSAFDRKDFYEAHQVYKSLNFRFLRQKKFQQLTDILYDGALKFFALDLNQSGIDLARMFGELLEKGDLSPTPDLIHKIAELYRLIPSKPDNERPYFLNLAISWSKKRNPETLAGHTFLHAAIGRILVDEAKFDGAAYHFVRALDPVQCLIALQHVPIPEIPANGDDLIEDAPEDDNFNNPDQRLLGLAVLDFLALERLDLAKQLFVDFVAQHKNPEVQAKCYNFRILALISALLSLCVKGDSVTAEEFGQLQMAICDTYKGNPRVEKLMTRIGQIYCRFKTPNSNPWSGIMAGMFSKESPSDTGTTANTRKETEKVNLQSDFDFD